MINQLVIFEVAGQLYGMDSMFVKTVEAGIARLVGLPGAPECIDGLVELRGEMVPVCNLYTKFNLGKKNTAASQTIYMNSSFGCIGCVCDNVSEIGAVTEDLQMGLPQIACAAGTDYVKGIIRHKNQLITVINHDKLLTQEEMVALKNAMKALKEE